MQGAHSPGADVPVPLASWSFGSWHLTLGRRPVDRQRLAARYDGAAATWRRTLARHGTAPGYRSLLARVFRQPRYRPRAEDLVVLDAGIGTGAMSHALWQVLAKRFRLVGIDISPAMLAEARHLSDYGIDLTLDQADLTALPYPDASFDIVLVAHVVEHLGRPDHALVELVRVLKPGGVVVCCITRPSPGGAWIGWAWRTHRVARRTALSWLADSGLQSVRALPLPKGTTARQLSLGYVGRKPDQV